MNPKDRTILEAYRRRRDAYNQLGTLVHSVLEDIVTKCGVVPMTIHHRLKSEESLLDKLYRRSDSIKSLEDVKDILGERIVLYYSDEVGVIGQSIEEHFTVDRESSSDKGELLNPDAFGYLSMHYVCTLPEDRGYPEELLGISFEIQVRTCLQHVWADISHDLVYKSHVEVPREIKRSLSRLAGLLELADSEFIRIRDNMRTYTALIHTRIVDDEADEIDVDLVSLNEYMLYNSEMRRFIRRLADIEGSEIFEVNPEGYIEQLAFLGINTLGGLSDMMRKCEETAYSMAVENLSGTELDIISSNAALRFLTRSYMINKNYSQEQMKAFFMLSLIDADRAERHAKSLAEYAAKYKT